MFEGTKGVARGAGEERKTEANKNPLSKGPGSNFATRVTSEHLHISINHKQIKIAGQGDDAEATPQHFSIHILIDYDETWHIEHSPSPRLNRPVSTPQRCDADPYSVQTRSIVQAQGWHPAPKHPPLFASASAATPTSTPTPAPSPCPVPLLLPPSLPMSPADGEFMAEILRHSETKTVIPLTAWPKIAAARGLAVNSAPCSSFNSYHQCHPGARFSPERSAVETNSAVNGVGPTQQARRSANDGTAEGSIPSSPLVSGEVTTVRSTSARSATYWPSSGVQHGTSAADERFTLLKEHNARTAEDAGTLRKSQPRRAGGVVHLRP
ncbi:hypothetical protein DL771_001860 [Monosporascus sp. 5C6A]|nr:hypothetical protein DL771_001860 [Monosporascus sp. 5C6A]